MGERWIDLHGKLGLFVLGESFGMGAESLRGQLRIFFLFAV